MLQNIPEAVVTLNQQIRQLEARSDALSDWLHLWTLFVAVGVIVELVLHVHHSWRALPYLSKSHRSVELIATAMVAIGVSGELFVEYRAAVVQTALRNVNAKVAANFNNEAAQARVDASRAQQLAADTSDRAASLELSAAKYRTEAAAVELELQRLQQRVAGRHISGKDKSRIWESLRRYGPRRIQLTLVNADSETHALAIDVFTALAFDNPAHPSWQIGVDRQLTNTGLLGIRVTVEPTASERDVLFASELVKELKNSNLTVLGPMPPQNIGASMRGGGSNQLILNPRPPVNLEIGQKP